MPKKGANLIFEQVMLFMIGIGIFMVTFYIFTSYEWQYSSSITDDQLVEVSDWVVSNILGTSVSENMNATLKVTVPATIGNERYKINLTQEGLIVSTLDNEKSVFSPLSRINQTMSLGGSFSTAHGGEFIIYKRGNQIIIG